MLIGVYLHFFKLRDPHWEESKLIGSFPRDLLAIFAVRHRAEGTFSFEAVKLLSAPAALPGSWWRREERTISFRI